MVGTAVSSEDGSNAPESLSAYGDADITSVLRILAETQRDLARSRGGDRQTNKARILSSIKIPEFEGRIKNQRAQVPRVAKERRDHPAPQ